MMSNIDISEFDKGLHNVRNPLNSIALNAELGLMLIDQQASAEQIKHAFNEILQQAKCCDQLLIEMRNKSLIKVI